jgi:hypothetical protein
MPTQTDHQSRRRRLASARRIHELIAAGVSRFEAELTAANEAAALPPDPEPEPAPAPAIAPAAPPAPKPPDMRLELSVSVTGSASGFADAEIDLRAMDGARLLGTAAAAAEDALGPVRDARAAFEKTEAFRHFERLRCRHRELAAKAAAAAKDLDKAQARRALVLAAAEGDPAGARGEVLRARAGLESAADDRDATATHLEAAREAAGRELAQALRLAAGQALAAARRREDDVRTRLAEVLLELLPLLEDARAAEWVLGQDSLAKRFPL